MKTLLILNCFAVVALAGPLDQPAATPKPQFVPKVKTLDRPGGQGGSTALDQPSRGTGPLAANPLERPAIASGKSISIIVIQNLPGGGLLGRDGNVTVMIKGLPADFRVPDRTALKVKVQPKATVAQYRTVAGTMATAPAYTAIEVPKVPPL